MKNKSEITWEGSFTVEATMLMSIILMLMFLLIQLNLFQTDVVRITALLAEDSTYSQEEEAERGTWMAGAGKGLFYLSSAEIGRTAGSSRVTESYRSSPVTLVWGQPMTVNREIRRQVRHPVQFLWTVKAVCSGTG